MYFIRVKLIILIFLFEIVMKVYFLAIVEEKNYSDKLGKKVSYSPYNRKNRYS